jgi:phospholipase D1/2
VPLAQLALSWKDAKAHPALFAADAHGKKIKAAPAYVEEAHRPMRARGGGGCIVQVLRSAPRRLLQDENAALPAGAARQSTSQAQDNCLKAMLKVIRSADRFIYIEGQFFQSEFGEQVVDDPRVVSGPMGFSLDWERLPHYKKFAKALNLDEAKQVANRGGNPAAVIRWGGLLQVQADPDYPEFIARLKSILGNLAVVRGSQRVGEQQKNPRNQLAKALAARIEIAIRDGLPFHVYLVLPVHPEGTLDTLNIMHQVHLTMQSLVFGSASLVNRVRRAIYMKRLVKQKGLALTQAQHEAERLPLPDLADAVGTEWQEYLTLLNLRNYDVLGDSAVTEQVYVHSKLLIADDRAAVLGSANINDRSQLGDRDSELAITVYDTAVTHKPIDGTNAWPVSAVVQKLRADLWRKHFGITGGIRPATSLAGVIDKPGEPGTWRAIQAVARENSRSYEQAFNFIPRNNSVFNPPVGNKSVSCSLWPTFKYNNPLEHEKSGDLAAKMPFEADFWSGSWYELKKRPVFKAPMGVQGFIVALPTDWTRGENNDSGMNAKLLAGISGSGTQHASAPPTAPEKAA